MSKNVFNEEKANSVFAVKLRRLFKATGRTHSTLAQYIDEKLGESITRQAVGQWCNGVSCPNLRTVPIIAQFFDVSTDFLLTDTEIQTYKTDEKGVCEYTGLSEKAVQNIRNITHAETYISGSKLVSKILETDCFTDLVDEIAKFSNWEFVSKIVDFFSPALNKIVCAKSFDYDVRHAFMEMFSKFFALDFVSFDYSVILAKVDKTPSKEEILEMMTEKVWRTAKERAMLAEYKASQFLSIVMRSMPEKHPKDFCKDFSEIFVEVFLYKSKEKNIEITDNFIEFIKNAFKSCEEEGD